MLKLLIKNDLKLYKLPNYVNSWDQFKSECFKLFALTSLEVVHQDERS